jgi:hypothetical protein
VEGQPSHHLPGQTGEGHPLDEQESDWEDLDELIANDQASDIRHPSVDVPAHGCPFSSETETIFHAALAVVQEQGIVPEGYGVAEEEWFAEGYPTHEHIHLGRGGNKISVTLPIEVWWARAVRWVQGLELMEHLMVEEGL